MSLKVSTKRFQWSKRLVTFVAVFALLAQPMYALVVTRVASAVTSTQIVTPVAMNGWAKYYNAPSSFVSTSAPLGVGALQLSANNDSEISMHWKSAADTSTLASNLNVHYSTKRIAGPAHAAAAYAVVVDPDGNTATSDGFYAIYEPVYNGGSNYDDWNTWNITAASNFWYTGAYGPRPTGAVNYTSLNNVLVSMPNATITATIINFGSGNGGWVSLVDNVKTVDDVIYDFEPFTAPTAAAQTDQVVLQSDFANTMNTWTFHDDVADAANPNPTANHEVAANPAPTAGNNGAVRLTANAANQRWNLASLQYSGTRLADVAALGFNHPSKSGWQGRLVYVPTGVTANTWGSHEAVASNGQWQWSRMITGAESAWPDGNTSSSRSWNDIVSAFPNATITAIDNAAFGSLYLRTDNPSVTYWDYVYLATSTQNTRYNFEIVIPDTQAPKVENISISPRINGNTGGNSVTVYFDLTDATGINLDKTYVMFADGPNTANQLRESIKVRPELIAGNSYKATFDSFQFVKANFVGTYNLQFTVEDTLGNRTSSKPSAFRGILVDNSGPTSTWTAPSNGDVISGTTRFSFDVADHTGVLSGYVKLNGPTTKQYNLVHDTGSVWYVDVPTSELADGSYTIDARFVDVFNRPRYGTNKGTVVVDNAAPVVTVDPVATSTATTRTITGTVADDNVVTSVEVSVDGGARWQLAVLDGTNWTLEVTGLPVATHTVIARATDQAGNVSSDDTTEEAPYWTTFEVQATTENRGGGNSDAEVPVRGGDEDDEDDDATPTNFIAFLPGTIGGIGIDNGPAATPLLTTPASTNNDDDDAEVLGAEDTKPNWSVVNAALAGFVTILAVVGLAGIRRKETDADNNTGARIFMIVPAAAAVIAFFLIEGFFAGPMIWFNVWTWLFAGILVVQAIVATLTTRTAND